MIYNDSCRQPAISRRERVVLCALIHAACALAWGFDHRPGAGRITSRRPVSRYPGFRDA